LNRVSSCRIAVANASSAGTPSPMRSAAMRTGQHAPHLVAVAGAGVQFDLVEVDHQGTSRPIG
jgi:hypothetical protein